VSPESQADLGQVANGSKLEISGQYPAAAAIATQVNNLSENLRTAGSTLTLTGHSLGGGLASFAALKVGLPAITFNAAGLSQKTIIGDGLDLTDANVPGQQIDSYYIAGEALTWVQTGHGWPAGSTPVVLTRPGREIPLAPPAGFTDPLTITERLRLHLMTSVLMAIGL